MEEEEDCHEEQSQTPCSKDAPSTINKNEVVDSEDQVQSLNSTSAFSTDKVFHSKEELVEWARETGKGLGFIIVISSSQPQKGGRKARLRLGCERGGTYRAPKNITSIDKMSRRGTGTRKIDCPFMLRGVKLDNGDDWLVEIVCESHNHPPAEQLEGHSVVGRLNEEEETLLFDMTKYMIKPRNILMAIKEKNKNNVSTMKTIYNARQKHRIVEKAGRSQMQQLMRKLNECQYVEWHRSNPLADNIKDLFWAHPSSVDILHAFPSVLIMDCTYKTNRYGLPLLEIVGVTCTDLTFSIAFVYMEAEREENYTWAMEKLKSLMKYDTMPNVILTDRDLALMNSIKRVFPDAKNLLCRFHISKNVLANSKKILKSKERSEAFITAWGQLMFSSSEHEYSQNLESLEIDYKDHSRVLKYIRDTWLTPHKERFVAAWTDKIMHFGNLTTNRAESAHAKLKKCLGSSQGDFESSWKVINSLIELQHTEIKASFEHSLNVVEHNFKPGLFRDLRGLVSRKALDMIHSESKRANDIGVDVISCKCVLKSTHGLPCAHEIAECMRNCSPISLSAIHPHWLKLNLKKSQPSSDSFEVSIDDEINTIWSRFHASNLTGKLALKRKLRELGNPATTFLVPPSEKAKTKGRRSLKALHSTRRDPSFFEIVDSTVSKYEAEVHEKPIYAKKSQKLTAKRSSNSMHYLGSFPSYMQPHIRGIVDVESDGHCGFRAIAGLLGFGEECWNKIREDLVDELCKYRSYYAKFFGSKLLAELLDSLSYFKIPAPRKNWMTLPDMGVLVATRYNVVLVHLSKQQCVTYLPLRSNPPPQSQPRIIAIGMVNGNHFVQVLLDDVAPIPPIVPNWKYWRQESAVGWDNKLLSRIKDFEEARISMRSHSESGDIIDVDESI